MAEQNAAEQQCCASRRGNYGCADKTLANEESESTETLTNAQWQTKGPEEDVPVDRHSGAATVVALCDGDVLLPPRCHCHRVATPHAARPPRILRFQIPFFAVQIFPAQQ